MKYFVDFRATIEINAKDEDEAEEILWNSAINKVVKEYPSFEILDVEDIYTEEELKGYCGKVKMKRLY